MGFIYSTRRWQLWSKSLAKLRVAPSFRTARPNRPTPSDNQGQAEVATALSRKINTSSAGGFHPQRFPQGFTIFAKFNFTQVYMVIHKTIQDFIVFLYVHISQADDMYDPNEMAIIKSKMKRLFPEGTDIEQKLYMTIREYNTFDRSKLTDLFKSSIEHFGKEGALAAAVHSDLSDIIMADGKVKADETRSLDRLRTIIDQHVVL